MRSGKYIQNFGWNTRKKERKNFVELVINGRKLLKWILEK
jgi:hypothetical protein